MLYLRKAKNEDMDLLFKWANDPIVRSNSFSTEPIPYENHKAWFNRIMHDPTVLQYILMDDDIPVGQIRLRMENTDAEIGYSIASEFRGKGYGHKILWLVGNEVKRNHPKIGRLVAKVKPDNLASNMLFKNAGYSIDYTYYSIDIRKEV